MIQGEINTIFEGLFIEINLRNKMCLLSCSYNPHRNNISYLETIGTILEKLSTSYDYCITILYLWWL